MYLSNTQSEKFKNNLQERLISILSIAENCKARYPNISEQKKHHLQYNEPSANTLLTGDKTIGDCYRITLSLLTIGIINDTEKFNPGRYPGLIPLLFPKYNNKVKRGSVCYIENTLLCRYINNINNFYSSGIGWWVISFGKGSEMSREEIKYYKNKEQINIDLKSQYVLAFIGDDKKNRPIQLIKITDLIDKMVVNGDARLEKSNISKNEKLEYLKKREKNKNNISIKVQGNVLSYFPKNIKKYTNIIHNKYQYIHLQIREDIHNLTTEYLNFLRIYVEAEKVGAYNYLLNNEYC